MKRIFKLGIFVTIGILACTLKTLISFAKINAQFITHGTNTGW